MHQCQRAAVTAALLVCGVALHAAAASPLRALADVRASLDTSTDPFAAVVPAAALLAWALLLWLGATVLLTVAGQLPGAAGRLAAALARSIAPRAVRRAVELTLGLSLAAGGVGLAAAPASATPPAGADSAAAHPAAAAPAAPSLDWPSTGAPAPNPVTVEGPARADQPAAPSDLVVVAPGDTLWSLAERALGPGATTEQVAAAWPAWWSANRDVVGADPHLIHPGDRLTPPPAAR